MDIDNKRQVIQLPAPEINKFGEYAIIILDENKLINRILKKVEKILDGMFYVVMLIIIKELTPQIQKNMLGTHWT